MANIIPSALAREGWVLEEPPTPHIERPAGCSKENQGCAPDCVQKRRGQLTANRSATCERCECMIIVCRETASLTLDRLRLYKLGRVRICTYCTDDDRRVDVKCSQD